MAMAQVIDIDEADITVLQENLDKTNGLCQSIHNSLVKLSNKSLQLEQRIKPLVTDTTKLNLYKSNIAECLALIENVRTYAASAAKLESVLNDQNNMYKAGVVKYIQSLKSARDLLLELNDKDLGDFKGIINSIKSAIKMGELNLKTYFELSMNKNSTPFDPQKLISSNEPFPYLEPKQIAEYKTILSYFSSVNLPIDNVLVDGRSKQVVDSMLILEPFTKPETRSLKVQYERGSNGINNYTEALCCFVSNEKSLFQEFYGPSNYQEYLHLALEPEFKIFNKIVKNLISFVETNLVSDGHLVFELIDALTKILREVPTDASTYTPLKKNLDAARLLSQSMFLEFMKGIDIKYQQVQAITNELSVNDVTVDCMSKLRKLGDYKEPCLVAITGMKPGSWIPSTPKPIWVNVYSSVPPNAKGMESGNPKFLLSSFFSDAIDAILISLEVKAKAMLKRSSLGFYLITNYFVAESLIQRSDINKILGSVGLERLARIKKRFLGFFLETWKKIAAYLMDVTVINTDKSSQSKEKDIIKEKFKKFNDEFDELVRIHKSFRITDPSVKKYLNNEISFIMPLYHRFHDKYAADYFKHSDKYVKWNNQQFDLLVKSL